jgi:hypothetical protein
MILRLTAREADLVEEALLAYTQALKDKARPFCTGPSAEGIDLCCRRLEAEALAATLSTRQACFIVAVGSRETARRALADVAA